MLDLLHIGYRQDNIPRVPIDDFIDNIKGMSVGQAVFAIGGVICAIFMFSLIVYRREYLVDSETMKYFLITPSSIGTKAGTIAIEDGAVIFKEFMGNEVFFSAPLKAIIDVKTEYKSFSSFQYFFLGLPSLFLEKNYLVIKFQENGKEQSARFYTHRESFINEKMKKEILKAIREFRGCDM